MTNDFKGWSLFNDVKCPTLRAWNRCNILFNIKEQQGNAVAHHYAKQFTRDGLILVLIMYEQIKQKGYEAMRKEVFQNV